MSQLILNSLTPGGNKRSYTLMQTCSTLPPSSKALSGSEKKCDNSFIIIILIVIGGERRKSNFILTSPLFPGYVSYLNYRCLSLSLYLRGLLKFTGTQK